MSEARPEPVLVPAAVLEGIAAVRRSGLKNALPDRPGLVCEASIS